MIKMILDNDVDKIKMYDEVGIDRIFLDLEINGKIDRQGGLDTVISDHTIDDVIEARKVIENADLLVRINPIHDHSNEEISAVIDAGADIIMLPMFKTKEEVETFIRLVNGAAKISLLLETSEALARIDDILEVDGIDEIHVGLNDLHLSLGLTFMFELMAGSLLEYLTDKFKAKGIEFGIGGVSRIGSGNLSAEKILNEHVRLGSTRVILSRAFKEGNMDATTLKNELDILHQVLDKARLKDNSELLDNKYQLKNQVDNLVFNLVNKGHF
ncbi:aldolase/citrate lyase family protein [Vibrio sp. A2-1]|uniref:aldolase/citrate lyase family protein n=1 Tax=Vibrio sp. A2-1 TaxID=2912252 RepID=UPI001F02E1AF|nr:aldolase/citrate lyase family protein [Vibrio sp. A2-1]MCF7487627.1 aldolase/citrate lyase family protein [Vibrio sp. A2-1]